MKLPKVLYVSVQNTTASPEDQYFSATEAAEDHAETGEIVQVGRYELVEVGTVTATPTFVPKKKVL